MSPVPARIAASLRRALESPCEILFPRRCFSCSVRVEGTAPLCGECEGEMTGPHGPLCYACRGESPLSAGLAPGRICREPKHEDFGVCGGFLMRGAGADLIHALKYAGATRVAPFIAQRMLAAWWRLPGAHDYLIPVPLHASRERERGFNQSRLLAEELTKATGVLTAPGLLARARATAAQAGLAPELRPANVAGAFAAPFPLALMGKRVVLVDDVATTGATLGACAEVILGCGAAHVTALVGALS